MHAVASSIINSRPTSQADQHDRRVVALPRRPYKDVDCMLMKTGWLWWRGQIKSAQGAAREREREWEGRITTTEYFRTCDKKPGKEAVNCCVHMEKLVSQCNQFLLARQLNEWMNATDQWSDRLMDVAESTHVPGEENAEQHNTYITHIT